ncbi:amidohydrolase [Peribacillus alkalitolerans]|uniref:amidohydrolase n=1 Tax=Peribacillus alkalitolerans TaxID=1550385 RepID=UPI0013D48121|nr:amidohydrolase [Peribacillus alkalitolerans]
MGKLWHGGTIYTMAQENEKVEAVYTKDGKIVETGNYLELKHKYGNESEEVFLNGSMMLPGLVDGHLHLIGHGESLLRLDLSNMKSREQVLEAIMKKCSETPAGEWVVAEGWNENNWLNQTIITVDELDAISQKHPIVLKRVCRHALLANTTAMNVGGVSSDSIPPSGGDFGRFENGRLNGLFLDLAQSKILDHLPGINEEYLKRALRIAINDCYKYGITGVHTEDLFYYNGFHPTYNAIKEVIEEELPIRAHLLVHHEVIDDMDSSGHCFKSGSAHVEFGPMKIFADGSLGGRTALLSRPYADDPANRGIAIFTQEELLELVKKARKKNLPVAIHAIGDEAFSYALEAIIECPPPCGTRDRLIHASVLRKDLIEKCKGLPLVLDIQPVFVASDGRWAMERLGNDPVYLPYAWKTLIKAELICAGGSDAPIERLNPLYGIHAAIYRKPFEAASEAFLPDECLTMFEAVQLFTCKNAYAACNENRFGYIKAGYDADFTVFHEDLFTLKDEELLSAKVKMTVIGEKSVYYQA